MTKTYRKLLQENIVLFALNHIIKPRDITDDIIPVTIKWLQQKRQELRERELYEPQEVEDIMTELLEELRK